MIVGIEVGHHPASRRFMSADIGRLLTDAVEKGRGSFAAFVVAGLVGGGPPGPVAAAPSGAPSYTHRTDASHTREGTGDGGRSSLSAMVLRFCTMAARWNSSRAPESPRSRIRSNR